jgi:hypothetical protein
MYVYAQMISTQVIPRRHNRQSDTFFLSLALGIKSPFIIQALNISIHLSQEKQDLLLSVATSNMGNQ